MMASISVSSSFLTLLYLIFHIIRYSEGLSTYKQIPITVLSGFLGSGKTTLLQHLLNNKQGLKIAVIVNDVADINIDSKLIVGQTVASNDSNSGGKNQAPAGIVQLSNGCACCSLADELLPSISELITISDLKSQALANDDNDDGDEYGSFDHIVIELSGVASPKAIRANFQEADYFGVPLMERVKLDTMVTVVDCSTFLTHLRDEKGRRINEDESPDLFFKNEEERMMKERDNDSVGRYWSDLESNTPETATISQLIIEQTEISDVILLNKLDTLPPNDSELRRIETVVTALNSKAKVLKTKFGVVENLCDVLGAAKGLGVTEAGIGDDHRESVHAVEKDMTNVICSDQNCSNPSHNHDHSHDHVHLNSNHDHTDNSSSSCNDPNCNDTFHSHEHLHEHNTSTRSIPGGIGTFIYRARKPFHPQRLSSLLPSLPIVRGLPTSSHMNRNMLNNPTDSDDEERKHIFGSIIRSKGFSWLADSHIAAMYWSHAGSSFEMQCLGRWWATLDRDQWPEDAVDDILHDFDCISHDDNVDIELNSVGDRRQEIVLIGQGLGDLEKQEIVRRNLNSCLLTDEEFELYKSIHADEKKLKEIFVNPFHVQMLTY